MRNLLIITRRLGLAKETPYNYNILYAYLESIDVENKLYQPIEGTFYINTNRDFIEIRNTIKGLMDVNDQYLVVDITNSRIDGLVPNAFWSKLKADKTPVTTVSSAPKELSTEAPTE